MTYTMRQIEKFSRLSRGRFYARLIDLSYSDVDFTYDGADNSILAYDVLNRIRTDLMAMNYEFKDIFFEAKQNKEITRTHYDRLMELNNLAPYVYTKGKEYVNYNRYVRLCALFSFVPIIEMNEISDIFDFVNENRE